MSQPPLQQWHSANEELVALMRLEEGARRCTSREQARAFIRQADQVKRHLWGTTEGTIVSHQ